MGLAGLTSDTLPSRPQSSLAQWGAAAAMQVVSRRRSEVRLPWLHHLAAAQEEQHADQTDTEGEETEEESESEMEEYKLREVGGRAGAQGPSAHGGRGRGRGGSRGLCRSPGPWDVAAARFTPPQTPRTSLSLSAVPHCTPRKSGRAGSLGPFYRSKH